MKTETVEEYLKRGGELKKLPITETADHFTTWKKKRVKWKLKHDASPENKKYVTRKKSSG